MKRNVLFPLLVVAAVLALPSPVQARYLEQMQIHQYVQNAPAPLGPPPYHDGMNLYQYVRSNPTVYLDPSGEVVVMIAGWGQDAASMKPIRDAVVQELGRRLSKYVLNDDFHQIYVVDLSNGPATGGYDAALRKEYQDFVARKKDICRLEQFIAIGHSSGATAIHQEARAGTFTRTGGKDTPAAYPAYLGLVDMWLPLGKTHEMSGLDSSTYAEHYRQRITPSIAGIPETLIDWETHFSILRKAQVINSIAKKAADEYEAAVKVNIRFPGVPKKWRTDREKNWW